MFKFPCLSLRKVFECGLAAIALTALVSHPALASY